MENKIYDEDAKLTPEEEQRVDKMIQKIIEEAIKEYKEGYPEKGADKSVYIL